MISFEINHVDIFVDTPKAEIKERKICHTETIELLPAPLTYYTDLGLVIKRQVKQTNIFKIYIYDVIYVSSIRAVP